MRKPKPASKLQVRSDADRALLFLYLLSRGIPDEGAFSSRKPGVAQVKCLAAIAGWPHERAEQAFADLVSKGYADKQT
jgi:hypothetical protein